MSATALALVVTAALLHATWNPPPSAVRTRFLFLW